MRHSRSILITLAAAQLVGCSSFVPPVTGAAGKMVALDDAQQTETSDERDKFNKAFDTCSDAYDKLSGKRSYAQWGEVSLAVLGIVAGSIVVPMLAARTVVPKSTVAAWGGVAGATNAAQLELHSEGLSAYDAGASLKQMRDDLKTAMDAYTTADTHVKRQQAINAMTVACKFPGLPLGVEPLPKPPDTRASGAK